MSDDRREARPGEAVTQLVDSALKLSASVAQVVAEAATGKPQQNRPGDTHLQSIIRHGTTAAGSIVSTVVSAARSDDAAAASQAPPAPLPRVSAGASLRIPLSIDNPGDRPMENIVPALAGVFHAGARAADSIGVAFAPERLTVGPHDFEKLVVTISVPEGTATGPWDVAFTLTGQEERPTTLSFEVI